MTFQKKNGLIYIEEGECYNFANCESCESMQVIPMDKYMNGQKECDSCKNKPKETKKTTCDQCKTDYTEAEGHDCPMAWCDSCEGFFDKDEHECFSQESSDPSDGEGDQETDASGSEDSGVVDGDVVEDDTAKPNKENSEEEEV